MNRESVHNATTWGPIETGFSPANIANSPRVYHPIGERAPVHVLACDPGFAAFGFAIVQLTTDGERVVGLGVLRTKRSPAKRGVFASDDALRRARELALQLGEILDSHNVIAIAAESMSHVRNSSAAAKVSLAWGVLAALTARDLPLLQVSPQGIKKAIVGRPGASKADVQLKLLQRYGAATADLLSAVPASLHEHAYDALGALVACLDSETLRLARTMAGAA